MFAKTRGGVFFCFLKSAKCNYNTQFYNIIIALRSLTTKWFKHVDLILKMCLLKNLANQIMCPWSHFFLVLRGTGRSGVDENGLHVLQKNNIRAVASSRLVELQAWQQISKIYIIAGMFKTFTPIITNYDKTNEHTSFKMRYWKLGTGGRILETGVEGEGGGDVLT